MMLIWLAFMIFGAIFIYPHFGTIYRGLPLCDVFSLLMNNAFPTLCEICVFVFLYVYWVRESNEKSKSGKKKVSVIESIGDEEQRIDHQENYESKTEQAQVGENNDLPATRNSSL